MWFLTILGVTVTNPIQNKQLLVNCYENSNTLEMFPSDLKFCITLTPKLEMTSACHLQRGVKAALTVNSVSYQMNTTLSNFDFKNTREICFVCDPSIEASGCVDLKKASLGRLSLEDVSRWIQPSVSILKRQQLNLLNCFAHSPGASGTCAAGTTSETKGSYAIIKRKHLTLNSLALIECATLGSGSPANSLEMWITTASGEARLTLTSFTARETVIDGQVYVVSEADVEEDLYSIAASSAILNISATLAFIINGVEVEVSDFTEQYAGPDFGNLFDRIEMRVLGSGIDILTVHSANLAPIMAANDQLKALGIERAHARIAIYPECSTLHEPLFLDVGEIPISFASGAMYHYSCSKLSSDASECEERLKLLQAAAFSSNPPFVALELFFYKSNAVEQIAAIFITEHGQACFTRLVLNMRVAGFTLNLFRDAALGDCYLSAEKQYSLALMVKYDDGHLIEVLRTEQMFSQGTENVEFQCGSDCFSIIKRIRAVKTHLLGIYDKNGGLVEEYNVDAVYYVDFSKTINYCLIALGVETVVFLPAAIVIVNFKERIFKNIAMRRRRNVQLKEVDEL